MRNVNDRMLLALTLSQLCFITSVRTTERDMEGEKLRELVSELFSRARLFSKHISDMSSVWIELPTYVESQGATLH